MRPWADVPLTIRAAQCRVGGAFEPIKGFPADQARRRLHEYGGPRRRHLV